MLSRLDEKARQIDNISYLALLDVVFVGDVVVESPDVVGPAVCRFLGRFRDAFHGLVILHVGQLGNRLLHRTVVCVSLRSEGGIGRLHLDAAKMPPPLDMTLYL